MCGSGGLFRNWVAIVEKCPRCRLRFERGEGEFIGAVGVNTVVTFAVILAITVAATVSIARDGGYVGYLVAAVVTALALPIAFHPFSKTIWVAITLAIDPLEDGEAPGVVTTERPRQQG